MARQKKATNSQKQQLTEPVLDQANQPIPEATTEVTQATMETPTIEATVETDETTSQTNQQELVEPPTSSAPTFVTEPVITISIADACTQLAMPEQMFRLALQPSHPEDFDILKELSLEEFKIIAQTLQRKVLGGDELSTEQSELNQQQQPQLQTALAQTQSSIPTDQRQKLEMGTNNALAQFAGEYVLTLDKITSALAYTASKKSLNNFVTIHSNVFRDGLEDYLEEFAEEMTTAAHAISQVSAKDFLHNHGIAPKERRANRAITEILNLATNV